MPVCASLPLAPRGQAAPTFSTARPPSFSIWTSLQADDQPHFIATGDFNEDGATDLAVTNELSSNVSIFLGDGRGGFGIARNYGLGINRPRSIGPQSIVVADFNGDRHLDFVTANLNQEESLSLRLGDGRGNFETLSTFTVGESITFVAAGDFNVDGKLDVAVAIRGGDFLQGEGPVYHVPGAVSVLLGDGAGSFSAPRVVHSYPKSLMPTSLAVGDFNEDGSADLAVTNSERFLPPYSPDQNEPGFVSVLLSRGADGLGAARDFPVRGNSPRGMSQAFIVTHDFNGDDNLDLASAGVYSSTVSLLFGDGAGSFGDATNFPAGLFPASLAAGDFNGDGDLDLVGADSASMSIIPGEGNGNFGTPILFADYDYFFVTAADINKDRKPDLVLTRTLGFTSTTSAESVAILINNSSFTPMPTSGLALLAAENSERAIALDSVTFKRDPFPVCTRHNFSSDRRTRVMLFARNAGLTPDEDVSSVTAGAEDSGHLTHPLTVEFVGKVPNVDGLTEIIVKLPDSIRNAGYVWISINVRGVVSNKVLVKIEPSDCPTS